MNGFVAQLVTLALHGNHVVAGGSSPDFLATNSAAQFCEWIRFVRAGRGWFGAGPINESLLADSVDGWFEYLRKKRARSLLVRQQRVDDPVERRRLLGGFLGGEWTIVVELADGKIERWLARWELGDRTRADKKIWRVTYQRLSSRKEPSLPRTVLAPAARQLREALTAIHAFSVRMECGGFTESFARGLQALAQQGGVEGYHRDMLPAGAPSEVAGLVHACQHAWVFGGMGSWNDLAFPGDEKEYDRVSHELYEALMIAIPAAVDGYAAWRPNRVGAGMV